MPKRRIKTILIALAALPVLAIIALVVTAMFAGGSAGGTLASGRSVMTYSDSISLTSSFTSDTATIETAGTQIVVKPTSLMVNGTTVAEIDEEVTDVQVLVKYGVITFVADGSPVATTLR